MFSLAVTIIYTVANVFLGMLFLHLLGYKKPGIAGENVWVPLASAFMLGLGVVSSLWLLIGLAGWLSPLVVVTLLVVFLAGGTPRFLALLPDLMNALRDLRRWLQGQDRPMVAVLFVAIAFLGLLGMGAFIKPPMGDAEAFYMTYPKIMAASERVVEMPGGYADFSRIGLLGEMHFAALIELGGLHAAKLFVWIVALATIVMLLVLGNYVGLGHTGLCFLFLMAVTSSAFTNHTGDGKVDLFGAAVGVGAVYWALRSGEPGRGGPGLRVAGMLAGFGVVAKLSYFVALLPPLFLIVVWNAWIPVGQIGTRFMKQLFSLVGPVAAFSSWFAIGMVPHIIKNAWLFSAPLAPVMGGGGASWVNQTWFSEADTAWILLTYPLALAFGRYPMQSGNLSLLFLAFAPLLFLIPALRTRVKRPLVQITGAAILGTGLWMALRPSVIAPRYLLATLFLFAPVVALAAERTYLDEARPRILSVTMILTTLMALIIVASPLTKLPKYFVDVIRGTFPECGLASGYCDPLSKLNDRAAQGDRVFFAGYYSYWLRSDLLQCRDNRQDELALVNAGSTDERWATVYARGFRYIVIDKVTHADKWKTWLPATAPSWLEVAEIVSTGELSILSLTARSGASSTPVHVTCVRISPPAWDVRSD